MKKKRNRSRLKKNTKRKMNKRNKRTKRRRTYSLRRGKRNRSNKKLYGGDGVDIEGLISGLDKIISLGPLKARLDLTAINVDQVIRDKELYIPGHDIGEDSIASRILFRIWHNYGCVLSDETLYRLFKAMFFHSVLGQYEKELKNSQEFGGNYIGIEDDASRNAIYDKLINKYPEIKDMGIIFLKLKHFGEDERIFPDTDLNHEKIRLAWRTLLIILVNLVIIEGGGLDSPDRLELSKYIVLTTTPDATKMRSRHSIKMIRRILGEVNKLVGEMKLYVSEVSASTYCSIDYIKFNEGLRNDIFPIDGGSTEQYGEDLTLQEFKDAFTGTDGSVVPDDYILSLNVGDRHKDTPQMAEGVPPAPAPAALEPAPAALEPEPAVQQGLTEDQKAAYDNLLQFGYTPAATLRALESVNWDLDRASDVILQ